MGRKNFDFVTACKLRVAAIEALDEHAAFLGSLDALVARVKAGDLQPEEITAFEDAIRADRVRTNQKRAWVASL